MLLQSAILLLASLARAELGWARVWGTSRQLIARVSVLFEQYLPDA
jgi:hypothetical protein